MRAITACVIPLSIAAGVAFMLPFIVIFLMGVIDGTDLTFYSGSAQLFAKQFWHGEFYPRWLMDANSGLGSPVFYFYPPVAAYLSTPLSFLNYVDATGILPLVVGMGVAMIASALTAYIWLLGRMEPKFALMGALVYELLPYRIEYTYLDFNLAQCWALAWFPLILLGLDRLRLEKPYAVPILSGAVGLLLMTHIPSSITFLPILPLLLMAESNRKTWPLQLTRLGFCIALGMSLASIYLLPFAANRSHVSPEAMMGVQYDYMQNFLSMAFVYTMPFIAVIVTWIWVATPKRERKALWRWYALMLLIIFMMTPLSQPIWDLIPPLRFLQFPVMRFYAPLLVVLTMILTHAFTRLRLPKAFYVLLGAYAVAHLVYAHDIYTTVRAWPKPRTDVVMEVMGNVYATHITPAPEYRTRAADPAFMQLSSLTDWLRQAGAQAELTEGEGSVQVTDWQPRRIALKAHVTSPTALLTLHRFYFPGWSVKMGNETVKPDLSASSYFGFMETEIPKGDYMLTFTLDQVAGEHKGALISALALTLILLWLIKDREYNKRAT